MTTIISIKGKNTRMGSLFKTPKHNLLYKGRPALEQTVEYMSQFGEVKVMTHENSPPDTGIVDMLLQMDLPDKFFVVDCDVIPIRLNTPTGTTVYCFKNPNYNSIPESVEGDDGFLEFKFKTSPPTTYSNFLVSRGGVLKCNEKGEGYNFCGAGVYYFQTSHFFKDCADGCKTIAEVIEKMLKKHSALMPKADTASEIFRFGSLQTIHNNECN